MADRLSSAGSQTKDEAKSNVKENDSKKCCFTKVSESSSFPFNDDFCEGVKSGDVKVGSRKRKFPTTTDNKVNQYELASNGFTRIEKIKRTLFLEATKQHRGNGAEKLFSEYWDTLGRYLSMSDTTRLRNDTTKDKDSKTSEFCIDIFLKNFLITRSLRRLHNQLLLTIMKESMNTKIPEPNFKRHIPLSWKSNVHRKEKIKEISQDELKIMRLRFAYGINSALWSTSGEKIPYVCSELLPNSLSQKYTTSIHLPGELMIDSLVKKLAKSKEMTVSQNAIWLLVLAVKQYTINLLQQTIYNNKKSHLEETANTKITILDLTKTFASNSSSCTRHAWVQNIFSIDTMPLHFDNLQNIRQTILRDIESESLQRYKSETEKVLSEKHLEPRTPSNLLVEVKSDSSLSPRSPSPVHRGRGRGTKDLSALRAAASNSRKPSSEDNLKFKGTSVEVPLSENSNSKSLSGDGDKMEAPTSSTTNIDRGKGKGFKDLAALKARSIKNNNRSNNIAASSTLIQTSIKDVNPLHLQQNELNGNRFEKDSSDAIPLEGLKDTGTTLNSQSTKINQVCEGLEVLPLSTYASTDSENFLSLQNVSSNNSEVANIPKTLPAKSVT